MQKIKLYHYSNINIQQGKVEPLYLGANHYTFNDKNISNVNRAFYYLKRGRTEAIFKNSNYLYITEIDGARIYDLKRDKLNYIKKFIISGVVNISGLLQYIKRNYIGARYNIGNIEIACIFQALPIKKKIKNNKGV